MTKILAILGSASEVLNGSQYSTLSFALLFRTLGESADDCVMKRMKQRMRSALQHRFPVTELHVVAAMLDPSQCNLGSVQNYLRENYVTAVYMLGRSLQKYLDDTVGTHEQTVAPGSGQQVEADYVPLSWKRADLDLLSTHVSPVATFDREIQQYR